MDENAVVEFMVANGIAERLLAEHVADRLGNCRRCAVGAQRGHHSWPCTIYGHAIRAREVERHRSGHRRRAT